MFVKKVRNMKLHMNMKRESFGYFKFHFRLPLRDKNREDINLCKALSHVVFLPFDTFNAFVSKKLIPEV